MKKQIRIDFHNHWKNVPGYETEIECRIIPVLNITYWNHGIGYISLILRFGWLFWTITVSYFNPSIK